MIEWFFRRLAEFGERTALAEGERATTYAELVLAIERASARLDAPEFREARLVGLEGGFELDSIALLLALFRSGKVVVPLTLGMRAQRETLLRVAGAHLLLELSPGKAHESVSFESEEPIALSPLFERLSGPGIVLFTSGTSGTPKAILHDADRLFAKFEKKRSEKSILSFLLFDHIGGIDTLLRTLSSGGTLVRPTARDAASVLDSLARHRVDTLPASPTFLQMLVVSGLLDTTDLSALRTIAYGTEPMPEGLLRRLGEKLPGVSFVQTYGMTELGVLPSESKNRDSLFLRFKGGDFETKVKDGTLWVRAQGAMIGYLNAPDQFDEDGFFNTFDVVEVDGDYLRILGRRSDMINVGGQKVFPTEVEDRLLELENVAEVVVYGKANPLMGQMVAAKIRLEKDEEEAAFKRRMHAFCRTCLAPYQIPRFVELCGEGLTNERLKKVRREK